MNEIRQTISCKSDFVSIRGHKVNKTMIKHISLTWFVLVLISIITSDIFINFSITNLRTDDIYYQYFYLSHDTGYTHPIDVTKPIRNINDIVLSQINHYQSMNGRFVVHTITQLFCGLLDRNVFNFFNTLVFAGMLLLLPSFFKVKDALMSIIVVCPFWLLFPYKACYTMSIAFAVNYLWTSAACVLFLYLLSNNHTIIKNKIIRYVSFFSFGAIVGSMHEGFTFGIGFALFIHTIICLIKKRSINWPLILGFWIGCMALLASPANLSRIVINHSESTTNILDFIDKRLLVFSHLRRFWIAMVLVIIMSIKEDGYIKFNDKNINLPNIVLGCLLFVLVIGFVNERSLFGIEFFSTLLIINIVCHSRIFNSIAKYIAVLLTFLVIYGCGKIYHYSQIYSDEYTEVCQQIKNNQIIVLNDIQPSFWTKYFNHFNSFEYEINTIKFECEYTKKRK